MSAQAPDGEPREQLFTIAYEDEHLLVIDKGAGLVVHPAKGHREDTLAQLLAPLLAGGEAERAGIVHRLDRDTSGLMVVARSEQAHAQLQRALSERRIEREYIALVEGRPPARTGTIDAPIGRDPRVRTRMAVDGAGAREARTHFTLQRALPRTSLLAVRLDTGRTHQIRVHLQAIGHPVAGDPEYGTPGLLGLTRQFLHASRLAFEHPITAQPLELRSSLPADLQAALQLAERIS
ncbi:MAG TPA: RluA family pseudouridine synthase [Solirubrobacteraceae bacterium]|jgi:23S rRNA pseudouridine1911/1915/1917 synthase